MKPLFLTPVMALSLSLSLAACQTASTPPTQTGSLDTQTTTAPVLPTRSYPALNKHHASGSLRLDKNTLTLTLHLPELPEAQDTQAFATQKLDLSTTTKLFAQVSDSHGKTYAPTGADGDGAVNYTGGTITLTFNNLTPDELLFVDVQAKNGTTPIPQAQLATVIKHTTDASPVNATLNFQTAVAAKALKAMLPTHATQARSINLTDLKTLTDTITGVTGTAPNLTYSQNHPSLVNTPLLATHLQSQTPNALTAADYRQSGATVNLTVSGLAGSDKVQLQITDAASEVLTDLGNGTTPITGVTPGSGLTAIVTPFGTPSQTYTYNVSPTSLTLTEGNTTNLTITATPTMAVTNISPANGPAGTAVTITGTGFAGATDVSFNGSPAASFTVNSDTQITATVPTNATEGPITVVNGTSVNSSAFDVQRRMYVNDDAGGANNGTTWANAYNSLQTALTAADAGDEIWVAAGTYKPHSSNRATSFVMKPNVPLYGGFAGTETAITQRSISANPSILSGDLNNDDNYTSIPFANISENTNSVVFINQSNVTLDGFTIMGGNASGNISNSVVGDSGCGGGLLVFNGNDCNNATSPLPKTTNVSLKNLTVIHNTSGSHSGGAYINNTDAVIDASIFSRNVASLNGGGINFWHSDLGGSSSSSPVLSNSVIEKNQASDGGGASIEFDASPILRNVVFSENMAADDGGGILMSFSATPTLTNVTFSNNTATDEGGGIDYALSPNPVLKNVLFWSSTRSGPALDPANGVVEASSDPFVDSADPDGPDNIFLTADDGLRIKATATDVINLGVPITGPPDPLQDILGLDRVGRPEPGAYEFIPPPVIPDNVVLVDKDASGANNGTSWADAYTDLQTALANAQANEEIWIAAGKYTPAAAGNTNASFQMQANVDIYGGFAGSETSKEQRIAGANTVYLSGDIDNNDTGSGSTYNRVGINSKTIVSGANATLDGVTIQGASNASGNGGGMMIANTSPTLSNVTFLRNRAVSGGGVYIWGSAAPTFNNVVFLLNGANAGGGGGGGAIYNEATFTLNKGYFNGNRASFKGGAINNQSNSSATLKDTLFMNNVGQTNTANDIYNFEFTNVTVSNTATWNSNSEQSIYSLGPIQLNNITANRTIYCPTATHCTPKNVLLFNAGLSNTSNGIDGNYFISTSVGSIDDPFMNANSPLGNDDLPFTTDDGYRLKAGAAVINQGVLGGTIPGTDILGLSRVDAPEPGAYEYTP